MFIIIFWSKVKYENKKTKKQKQQNIKYTTPTITVTATSTKSNNYSDLSCILLLIYFVNSINMDMVRLHTYLNVKYIHILFADRYVILSPVSYFKHNFCFVTSIKTFGYPNN